VTCVSPGRTTHRAALKRSSCLKRTSALARSFPPTERIDLITARDGQRCKQCSVQELKDRKIGADAERLYVGAFLTLAKFFSPWRQPPAKTTTVSTEAAALEETRTALTFRQVSPQVSAALLSKFRTDLTPAQAEIEDAFKQQCPGFAVMRKLVLNFRSLLRGGKLAALRRWMKRAQKTGIHALTRFVRTLQQDLRAVEAAVTEPWSNGPVRDTSTVLKRSSAKCMDERASKLLRARPSPESRIDGPCVHQR
jgi:hypothetical protein